MRLEEHLHYTYSIFPSSEKVKSDVNLKFWQKPIYNYKLECELDPERSMENLLKQVNQRGQLNAWTEMLDSFSKFAVAALCIILIMPIASGKGTVVGTPIAFIISAGLFVEPIQDCFEAAS